MRRCPDAPPPSSPAANGGRCGQARHRTIGRHGCACPPRNSGAGSQPHPSRRVGNRGMPVASSSAGFSDKDTAFGARKPAFSRFIVGRPHRHGEGPPWNWGEAATSGSLPANSGSQVPALRARDPPANKGNPLGQHIARVDPRHHEDIARRATLHAVHRTNAFSLACGPSTNPMLICLRSAIFDRRTASSKNGMGLLSHSASTHHSRVTSSGLKISTPVPRQAGGQRPLSDRSL